jgi:outer membrane protein assembly factor BamA
MKNHWTFAGLIPLSLQFIFFPSQLFSATNQEVTAAEATTRAESIEQQQQEKARRLTPAKPGRVEQALEKYIGENPMNKYMGGIRGLHLRMGGLPSGSGFGLGPEYYRPDLGRGTVSFRAAAVGSQKLWYMVDTELQFPHLAQRYLNLGFRARRADANSVDYYGPGSGSQKSDRTNFRREENALESNLGFRPTRRYLTVGFTASYLWLNIGPGQSSLYTSSEEQFTPSVAPGIDRQTNYLRLGPFLEFDTRDKSGDPHTGTHLLVKLNQFSDSLFDRYSFKQVEGSIEQYLPFLNKKRVIALRARSVLSYPDAGNEVPFYMQPTLGGTSDLRGYRRFRFYDNDTFLVNAEYRWELFTLMDGAIFADAGKVFHRDGDFSLDNLESDVGFGIRFKTRRAVVFRLDTAFSHEGYGIWLTFDHVF